MPKPHYGLGPLKADFMISGMLQGVRVLSFTHFLQGPSASQLLADLGAEVIKIEPVGGSFERAWSAPDSFVGDHSTFFLLANRNVKSVAFDLKANSLQPALLELIKSADILIESFRPGAMERLGLGYETAKELNPTLIYCSLSGYGSSGPYKNRPGQDVLIQALSGLAAASGGANQPPTPAGASLVDQHAAVIGAMGILAALINRGKTGKGTRIESNLLNAALDLQIEPLGYFLNGAAPERSASNISSGYYKAPYGVFETADDFICLSINSPDSLARVFEDDWFNSVDAADELEKREVINERVAQHVAKHSTAALVKIFEENKIWYAPVNTYEDVITDPQVLHNDSFLDIELDDGKQARVLAHPVKYDGERPALHSRPPRLGEHTEEILESVGYDSEKIERLSAEKHILVAPPRDNSNE